MRFKFIILFIILLNANWALKAQPTAVTDSATILQQVPDSTSPTASIKKNSLEVLLKDNYLLNYTAKPTAQVQVLKQAGDHYYFFYILLFLSLLLGIVRVIDVRYFETLFRVFFNTSLRQSQLTDQLEQAKLLSLFYNIFFCINFGLFLYVLLENYLGGFNKMHWVWLQYCWLIPVIIYLIKYIVLVFMGWVSGYKEEAAIYIFITFLINKIMGIILLPLVFIIAFADKFVVSPVIIISFVIIILLFILRYFRSYNLLQNRIQFGRFHFFIFIFGLEIVPILVLYKAATHYLSIN